MTAMDQDSTARPALSPGPPPSSPSGERRVREATRGLFSMPTDSRRESRQVALGMALLVLISVVLLNLGIFQSAQSRLVHERWERLAGRADQSREQIRG